MRTRTRNGEHRGTLQNLDGYFYGTPTEKFHPPLDGVSTNFENPSRGFKGDDGICRSALHGFQSNGWLLLLDLKDI